MLNSLGKTLSSSRTESWQEAREVILTCRVLALNVFHSYFVCERSMTKLKSFWIEQPLISTWNKWAFSIHVPGLTANNLSVYVTPKRNMVIFMVISDIWTFWDDLLTIVSVLHMKWNPSHYGSFMLALMSCSLCNMTVNSIIEGKGSHWETLQWLGDVNRKLIVADECRSSHRKFRLPGVLDSWVSLPYLLFLTHSFFLSLF